MSKRETIVGTVIAIILTGVMVVGIAGAISRQDQLKQDESNYARQRQRDSNAWGDRAAAVLPR